MFHRFTRFAHGLSLVLVFIALAELTARVEDRLRYAVPWLHRPDFDDDLFVTLESGERSGRPNGSYKKFSMNALGFRGPEVNIPTEDLTSLVLLLGSSETFGMYESAGKDYPAQLREILAKHGDFQVVNTALPGMSVTAAMRAFQERFRKFEPDIVVVYISPLFDLNWKPTPPKIVDVAKKAASPVKVTVEPSFHLRIVERLKDVIDKPDFLQRTIDAKELAKRRAALGEGGVFEDVPMDIVDLHVKSLDALVKCLRDSGAVPILMTHAICSNSPPSKQDLRSLEPFLKHTPRATPKILLDYEAAVRRRVIEIGAEQDVVVIDLAESLNGIGKGFGDFVHFSDEGAAVVARLVADEILRLAKHSDSTANGLNSPNAFQ